MIEKILKRDGREVDFSIEKIANAVYQAAKATGGNNFDEAMDIAKAAVQYIERDGITTPTVEQIQDYVEKTLIETGHARTAKKYILYRAERSRVREMNTRLMKTYEDLTFVSANDIDVKRENAYIDGDTSKGTML